MIIELPKFEVKRLSDHFWSFEMACHCRRAECDVIYVDMDHIEYLEIKRAEIAKVFGHELPFIVMSGHRCVDHNKDCGGKPGSYHLIGKATDIYIPGHNMSMLAKYFSDADGLGTYISDNFLHIDNRGYKARWSKP
jgi:uncharacterized protein YcbK (DUF882 family)